jgi:hypothetical protein
MKIPAAEEISKIPIVFILGNPRSGTTLLQESLNAHPNIIAPFECDFVLYLHPRFGKIKRWTEKNINEFADAFLSLAITKKIWMVHKEDLLKDLMSVRKEATYPLLCKTVYFRMAGNKERILLLSDKFPTYSIFADRLLSIFPEAKFIHIIRDPRDNVNSRVKRLPGKNIFFNSWQWLMFNHFIERMKIKKPDRFFTIHYEEMVQKPDEIFHSLCTFLRIPFDTLMLEHKFAEKMKQFEDEKFFTQFKKVHSNMMEPINTSNIGKWQKEMSPENLAVTERITAKFAKEKYGYDLPLGQLALNIPLIKLLRTKLKYYAWFYYTRMRYRNFKYNAKYKKKQPF